MIRVIAHLFGWHTNACRGDVRCYSDAMVVTTLGWWRNVLPCGDDDCTEDHA